MRIVILFLLMFFTACEKNEEQIIQTKENEEVSIEQSDEKTELSDTNLPLPVADNNLSKNELKEPNQNSKQAYYQGIK